jgi:hypothetical protein
MNRRYSALLAGTVATFFVGCLATNLAMRALPNRLEPTTPPIRFRPLSAFPRLNLDHVRIAVRQVSYSQDERPASTSAIGPTPAVRQANPVTVPWDRLLEKPDSVLPPPAVGDLNPTVSLQPAPDEAAILRQLPAVCTSQIPGLGPTEIPDHSSFEAAPPGKQNAVPRESPFPQHASGVSSVDAAVESEADKSLAVDPHAELYAQSLYPSATQCAKCHQQIYDEWASSSHAYAAISPMFQRFEDTINKLTRGTVGYFCLRCHAPVATTLEHPRDQAIHDGPRVFREGITCVACHRVKEAYTKANGERRIEPGDTFQPVYGGGDGFGVELAVQYKDLFKTTTHPSETGEAQGIHARSIHFEQLTQSDFCMSCHQVAVPPGVKLEVVWDQYRASPAYRAGVTCQDCHMGQVPGVAAGYSVGPAAVISDRAVVTHRKHSNHAFFGPGGSIAHPGLFPDEPKADRWTPDQWLQFDWRVGWGTEAFEQQVSAGRSAASFPECWSHVDDRYDARQIIDANLKKLDYKRDLRRQVLENGSRIDGPTFASKPRSGAPLRFEYCVTNLNPGHNLPSGSLGAQPQIWLNVVLIGPDGSRLWESGYLDSQGDLADFQSFDVQSGNLARDSQLFNLQTKFLTTNVKGTDREMPIPINFDIDQLPFIRPAAQPVTVLNHPPLIRMEAHSLPPLGSRRAKFTVPGRVLRESGTYRLSVRLRSRLEPIYFMRLCEATPEMIRGMNESIIDVHPYSVAFQVE